MHGLETGVRLLAGALLILGNGFFVAIEFALTRVRQYRSDFQSDSVASVVNRAQ